MQYDSMVTEQILESTADFARPRTLHTRIVFLVEKIQVLWKRRKFFLQRFLIFLAVSLATVLLWPNHYAATATLMPPDDSSLSILGMLMGDTGGGSQAAGGAGAAIGSLLGMGTQGQLYVHAAGSRTVQDRMIQRFDLMKFYKTRYIEDCRKKLAWFTDVQEDRKSGTIDITFTDKDPKRAADIANAYVEELDRLMLGINSATAKQERVVTALRVQEAEVDLGSASKDLAEFASKNTTLDPDDQAKAAVEISATLEGQLLAAQADIKSLEQLYTPNNQRVYSARARVNELQKQLRDANSAGLAGENTEGSLPSVRKLPLIGIKYLDLFRKAKVREEVLKVLTQEYELARIRENHQVSTVSIMDPAIVPTKKSFPPRSLFLVALAFLSFWVTAFWVFLKEWWETADEHDEWKNLLITSSRIEPEQRLHPRAAQARDSR